MLTNFSFDTRLHKLLTFDDNHSEYRWMYSPRYAYGVGAINSTTHVRGHGHGLILIDAYSYRYLPVA